MADHDLLQLPNGVYVDTRRITGVKSESGGDHTVQIWVDKADKPVVIPTASREAQVELFRVVSGVFHARREREKAAHYDLFELPNGASVDVRRIRLVCMGISDNHAVDIWLDQDTKSWEIPTASKQAQLDLFEKLEEAIYSQPKNMSAAPMAVERKEVKSKSSKPRHKPLHDGPKKTIYTICVATLNLEEDEETQIYAPDQYFENKELAEMEILHYVSTEFYGKKLIREVTEGYVTPLDKIKAICAYVPDEGFLHLSWKISTLEV